MAYAPMAARPVIDSREFDRHVRNQMEWHFGSESGSPFWLRKRDTLEFDPISDVRGGNDLLLFPDVSDELRSVPVPDIIPQGLRSNLFRVYESGGTAGAPKRIIDSGYRSRLARWAVNSLRSQGVPESANWLHLGPTGPHVFGFDCAQLAAIGNGMFYTVDLDPRWVKRMIRAGRSKAAEEYVDHVLDQAREILQTQPVSVLSTTPPLVEAICSRPELHKLMKSTIEAIVWAGTSFSAESLRQVERTFFPDARVVGVYGNSLMGIAPQRPRGSGDEHPCVFEPFTETTRLDVVDESGDLVEYGKRGRVRFHLVSEEMFLPNVWERDTAIRVEPAEGSSVDGLADIQTLAALDGMDLIEGVY